VVVLSGAFFFACLIFLWEHLQQYNKSVIAYCALLTAMFTGAVNLYNYDATRRLTLETFIPGTLLFIMSDVTLAFNKFYFQEGFLNIVIMATYAGAQYYIARGFIKHLKRRRQRNDRDKRVPHSPILEDSL